MNLAYKKILGKFTKVLGFGKTPPHVRKNSQMISFFFESLPYFTYVQVVQASKIVLLRLSDTSTGLHPPSNTKLDKHIVKPCICLSLLTNTETKIEPSKTKLKRHIMKRDKTQNLSTTENWNTNKEKKNKQER